MAVAPDNLVGVGMTPEGIEQNPAVYEFMAEMAYKGRAAQAAAPGGLGSWFRDYATRRYAAAGALPQSAVAALQGAWQLLARSVYSCRDKLHNTVADIPTSRPGLSRSEIVGWGLAPHLWYNVGDVRAAWELLLQAAAAAPSLPSCSSAFVYDLLDVSRELMSKVRCGGRYSVRNAAVHLLMTPYPACRVPIVTTFMCYGHCTPGCSGGTGARWAAYGWLSPLQFEAFSDCCYHSAAVV